MKAIAHLLKYDSSYGRFKFAVSIVGNCLHIENDNIELMAESDPRRIDWGIREIDVVLTVLVFFIVGSMLNGILRMVLKKYYFHTRRIPMLMQRLFMVLIIISCRLMTVLCRMGHVQQTVLCL
ncbi:MAG: D-erythrose-4-phosphate dehydrogenase [Candidatus Celerinatantimonas neptuna]|nr:MAG: D-erythrose-4-phosphate dehydrogenase [Candidatus Celerinatantimonas neptuna]